ncbi:WD40 repeat domain-containing protein [Nonomuraea wenchangensis]
MVDDDGTAGIYERAAGARLHRLADRSHDIGACTFPHDGQHLVTGGSHGTITLWRVADGRAGDHIPTGTSFITACGLSPDGTLFVTAHQVGNVYVWDGATRSRIGMHLNTIGAIPTCAFSPDGRPIAVAGEDRCVRFWRATSSKGGRKVILYPTGVPSCAFNPLSGLPATAGGDRTITVWDLGDDNKPVAGIRVALPVGGSAWSPDGRQLAAAGRAEGCTSSISFRGPLADFGGRSHYLSSSCGSQHPLIRLGCRTTNEVTVEIAGPAEAGPMQLAFLPGRIPQQTWITTVFGNRRGDQVQRQRADGGPCTREGVRGPGRGGAGRVSEPGCKQRLMVESGKRDTLQTCHQCRPEHRGDDPVNEHGGAARG